MQLLTLKNRYTVGLEKLEFAASQASIIFFVMMTSIRACSGSHHVGSFGMVWRTKI